MYYEYCTMLIALKATDKQKTYIPDYIPDSQPFMKDFVSFSLD